VIRAVRDEREEAGIVVQTIRRLQSRGVSADQVAIFYRVHAQSRALEEALRAADMPYQVLGGLRFFERAEVKNLVAYLRLAQNPKSDADLERIINVPTRGIGDKTVDRLKDLAGENTVCLFDAVDIAIRGDHVPTAAKKKLEAFQKLMNDLKAEATTLAPSELAEEVLERTGYKKLLVAADDAESDARLGNLEELVGAIADYEKDCEEQGEPATLSGWLERITLAAAVDALKDAPKVSLMTVHTAKGLEFRAVFITGMEEEIFPYRGVSGREPEELDEERRLAYVAITRAREHLTITYAGMRSLFGMTRYLEPSRFLGDIPEEAALHQGSIERALPEHPGARYRGHGGYGSAGNSGNYGSYGSYGSRPPQTSKPPSLAPGTRVVEREESDDEGGIRPGDRVLHQRYGKGIVERIEQGAAPMVVARFGVHGTRRILASYVTVDRRARGDVF
jgi:DNA helicase-2/ATP-dependent DNA helicase PcrA